MAFTGSEIPAGFFMPGRRCCVRKIENMMLTVFLVVSVENISWITGRILMITDRTTGRWKR